MQQNHINIPVPLATTFGQFVCGHWWQSFVSARAFRWITVHALKWICQNQKKQIPKTIKKKKNTSIFLNTMKNAVLIQNPNLIRSYHLSGQFLSSDFTLQPNSSNKTELDNLTFSSLRPWKSFYFFTIILLQTAPLLLSEIFQTTFFFKLPHSSLSLLVPTSTLKGSPGFMAQLLSKQSSQDNIIRLPSCCCQDFKSKNNSTPGKQAINTNKQTNQLRYESHQPKAYTYIYT